MSIKSFKQTASPGEGVQWTSMWAQSLHGSKSQERQGVGCDKVLQFIWRRVDICFNVPVPLVQIRLSILTLTVKSRQGICI